MASFSDHYRTMGVHRHAEATVIAAAYRALARQYHPDLNSGKRIDEDRLKGINEAYAVLSDVTQRRNYDRDWDAHHAPRPAPPRASSEPSRRATPTPQPTPPSQPASLHRKQRPWFVNVAGFVLVILVLRAGAGLLGEAPARPNTRPASSTRVPNTPTPPPGFMVLPPGGSCNVFTEGLDCVGQDTPQQEAVGGAPQAPQPTRVPAPSSWGFVETFDDTLILPPNETELTSAAITNVGLVLTIKAPGGYDGYLYEAMPSGGRDIDFHVDIASVDGWGEMSMIIRGVSGSPEWMFGVDPVAQEWNLYRTSDYTNEFFYWVEPRPYAAIAPGPLRSLAVRVTNGVPTLSINGQNVVQPYGIAMPEMSGSLIVGVGAGINPSSLTGHGETFTVTIEKAELREH